MADEGTRLPPPLTRPSNIPPDYDWSSLKDLNGDALEVHYRHILENLGKQPGLLGVIFRKRRTRFRTRPSCAASLISLIRKSGPASPLT